MHVDLIAILWFFLSGHWKDPGKIKENNQKIRTWESSILKDKAWEGIISNFL